MPLENVLKIFLIVSSDFFNNFRVSPTKRLKPSIYYRKTGKIFRYNVVHTNLQPRNLVSIPKIRGSVYTFPRSNVVLKHFLIIGPGSWFYVF